MSLPLPYNSGVHSLSPPGSSSTTSAPFTSKESNFLDTYFKIGDVATVASLVDVEWVKGHLRLLRAFAELKTKVESLDSSAWGIPDVPQHAERKWAWFVGLAVERFERWMESTASIDLQNLPPLDVIMVWHAYLLNPKSYAEDLFRLPGKGYSKLYYHLFAGLLPLLSSNPEAIFDKPNLARVTSWRSHTMTAFNPLPPFDELKKPNVLNVLKVRKVRCPYCDEINVTEYLNSDGTGYMQQKFYIACWKCRKPYNKESLALRRFFDDVKDNMSSIASVLYLFILSALKSRVISVAHCKARKLKYAISDVRGIAFHTVSRLMETITSKDQLEGIILRTKQILGAYNDDKLFSLDLMGAVIRQGTFIKKMHDISWTASGLDETVLKQAIARYHAFLDLLASSPSSFCVPTLDIDLVWHTHQLMPQRYSKDCTKFVGRFIDHDDKVEENALSSSFDDTCRAWQERFGVQYTHCGCPAPRPTIVHTLRRVKSLTSPRPKRLDGPELPKFPNATHPSDHNAVFAAHREQEATKLRHKRQVRHKRKQSLVHEAAFLAPIPAYHGQQLSKCIPWLATERIVCASFFHYCF
ncbi:hypothetical protein C8J56DRAFT_767239 [Mycena floridula]|nr:hypothetical protein C8J56DRAFT_767239 [Mycena floridula]